MAPVQRFGPLSLVTFPASQLGIYLRPATGGGVTPISPSGVLELSGAFAALNGPMFGICPDAGVSSGNAAYAITSCEQLDYMHFDTNGVSIPGRYPDRGITISVVGGNAVASHGAQIAPGTSVAIQLYPPLVWQGQNVASTSIDTDVVWRAGLAVLGDGNLAFAVMRSSMYDFADSLSGIGVISAGYTDGGGSAALVTPDGTVGSTEGRRVASWLVVRPRTSSRLWLEVVAVAGVVGTVVYLWSKRKRSRV